MNNLKCGSTREVRKVVNKVLSKDMLVRTYTDKVGNRKRCGNQRQVTYWLKPVAGYDFISYIERIHSALRKAGYNNVAHWTVSHHYNDYIRINAII